LGEETRSFPFLEGDKVKGGAILGDIVEDMDCFMDETIDEGFAVDDARGGGPKICGVGEADSNIEWEL
jgi:hypothetical protein